MLCLEVKLALLGIVAFASGQDLAASTCSSTESAASQTHARNHFLKGFGEPLFHVTMLQDDIRVGAYHASIMSRTADFAGSTCIDIGAGTGILSFFAAKAGAKTVYAVEPSDIGEVLKDIVSAQATNISSRIEVIHGFVSDLPAHVTQQSVDVILSECFGNLMLGEMPILDAYLEARDRFLKPRGLMFPEKVGLALAPISDVGLYQFVLNSVNQWANLTVKGVDFSAVYPHAVKKELSKALIIDVGAEMLVAPQQHWVFDLRSIERDLFHKIGFPFNFDINSTCVVTGVAGWFALGFPGDPSEPESASFRLSTGPDTPPTTWKQTVILLSRPLHVESGSTVSGFADFEYNISVYVKLKICVDSQQNKSTYCSYSEKVDLNQHIRLQSKPRDQP